MILDPGLWLPGDFVKTFATCVLKLSFVNIGDIYSYHTRDITIALNQTD